MFKLTFVCTGNLCRSPYAERVMQGLAPDWVAVRSAGTMDLSGRRSPSDLLEVAGTREIDLSEHRSAAISAEELGDADLVLCMARQHVPTAVVEGGARSECTFTLPEFVRRLEQTSGGAGDPDEARRLVAEIHRRRTQDETFVPAEEIDDPIGGPKKGYETMADRIEDLCNRVARGFEWATEGARSAS